ncbi:hypothetical protein OAO87_01025 [bacterium]|nr:hypothetical protein [bacterium]
MPPWVVAVRVGDLYGWTKEIVEHMTNPWTQNAVDLVRAEPALERFIVRASSEGLGFVRNHDIHTIEDIISQVARWSRSSAIEGVPPWVVAVRVGDLYGWCKQVANSSIIVRQVERGDDIAPLVLGGQGRTLWVGCSAVPGVDAPPGWQYLSGNDAQCVLAAF